MCVCVCVCVILLRGYGIYVLTQFRGPKIAFRCKEIQNDKMRPEVGPRFNLTSLSCNITHIQ